MTEGPKNFVVGPFFSPVVCFLAQSASVSEPTAAVPVTKASFLRQFNSSNVGDSPNSHGAASGSGLSGKESTSLSSSWVQTELGEA